MYFSILTEASSNKKNGNKSCTNNQIMMLYINLLQKNMKYVPKQKAFVVTIFDGACSCSSCIHCTCVPRKTTTIGEKEIILLITNYLMATCTVRVQSTHNKIIIIITTTTTTTTTTTIVIIGIHSSISMVVPKSYQREGQPRKTENELTNDR